MKVIEETLLLLASSFGCWVMWEGIFYVAKNIHISFGA